MCILICVTMCMKLSIEVRSQHQVSPLIVLYFMSQGLSLNLGLPIQVDGLDTKTQAFFCIVITSKYRQVQFYIGACHPSSGLHCSKK